MYSECQEWKKDYIKVCGGGKGGSDFCNYRVIAHSHLGGGWGGIVGGHAFPKKFGILDSLRVLLRSSEGHFLANYSDH